MEVLSAIAQTYKYMYICGSSTDLIKDCNTDHNFWKPNLELQQNYQMIL